LDWYGTPERVRGRITDCEADQEALTTHARGDPGNPVRAVFGTGSPDRPNPIGLPRVRIRPGRGTRVRVLGLDTTNGIPIVHIKRVIDAAER
jgi:tRNA (Thr-GGU) A37 N-methylase